MLFCKTSSLGHPANDDGDEIFDDPNPRVSYRNWEGVKTLVRCDIGLSANPREISIGAAANEPDPAYQGHCSGHNTTEYVISNAQSGLIIKMEKLTVRQIQKRSMY